MKENGYYKEHHRNCRRLHRCMAAARFLSFSDIHCRNFKSDQKWSLAASFGNAQKNEKFRREEMACSKTLYNYGDHGLLPLKAVELPEKLYRNIKTVSVCKNKRNFGTSIEERPEIVESHTEFGHCIIDTVIWNNQKEAPYILALGERMTRNAFGLKQ